MSFLELFHAFNVRCEGRRVRLKDFFSNRTLLVTADVGVAANVVLVLAPPLRFAFALQPLTPAQWLIVSFCSFSIIPVGAIYTAVSNALDKRSPKTRKRHSLPAESRL